jgi:transposase
MSNKNGKNPNMSKRYTDEFKMQLVELVNNGKTITDVVSEYNISRSSVTKWVSEMKTSGSFKAKDNRTEDENELLQLRKDLAEAKMEIDILKQAALIMGRKSK